MDIEICISKSDKVRLRASELNYELCRLKRHTDKTTGETIEDWVPEKYFASLGQALNRIMDLMVKASDAITLCELKVAVEAARADICRAWDTNRA